MNARTAIIIRTHDGSQDSVSQWFTAESAAPEFVVPSIADLYIWATSGGHPLTLDAYLRYCHDHPGELPTVAMTNRDNGDASTAGWGFVYNLTFAPACHGLRLEIQDRSERAEHWTIRILDQCDLLETAARYCDALAARVQTYADRHDGLTVPGGNPDTWTRRADRYRHHQSRQPAIAAAANLQAVYHPPTFDEPTPALQIAGVTVRAYVHRDGHLQVSVHVDDAKPWLVSRDQTVPVRVSVHGADSLTG